MDLPPLKSRGGAAGPIIIEGMEKIRPEVTGLRERVLVIRRQFHNPISWAPGPYQLTPNFQVSCPGVYPLPIIVMEPNKKEFWRVVNAATEQQLNLQLNFVNPPTPMELIALDGIPLPVDPSMQDTIKDSLLEWHGPISQRETAHGDFRDPEVVGEFVCHCHILDHEDGGMMAKILVKPKE